MDYSSLITRLYQVNIFGGVKLGLSNCMSMNAALGYPDKQFASIHAAGTNGKGSVCTKIAKALELSGKKVGLYTSPHLSCFRERIRINGCMISEQSIEKLLPHIFEIVEKENIPATFFEITTMLALLYFSQKKVDIAVLETGLGGRLDATNIVTPLLSIITSISMEHTEILGNSIESIAREKGGIIKQGIPVVLGPRTPKNVLTEIAHDKNSPLFIVEGRYSNFHDENKAIARKALEYFGVHTNALNEGLKALPPSRFEVFQSQVPSSDLPKAIVLDVAHNPDGILHLIEAINQRFPKEKIRIVFGLSKNKDIAGCCSALKGIAEHFYPVEAPNGRGLPAEGLVKALIAAGVPQKKITHLDKIEDSFSKARQDACSNGEILVVCGTFFIMGPVRAAMGLEEPRDFIDINEQITIDKR